MLGKTQLRKGSSGLGRRVSLSLVHSRWREGSSIPSWNKEGLLHSNPWKQTNTYRLNILGWDPKSTDLHLLMIIHMPNVTALDNLPEPCFTSFSLKTFLGSSFSSSWILYREFGAILGYSSLLFQFFKVFSQTCLWKLVTKKFLKALKEMQFLFIRLQDKQVFWSQTLTCYRTWGKIREVLLFSSFSAFPKQKLKFYRDEVVIYTTCKEQAGDLIFWRVISLCRDGGDENEVFLLLGKEKRVKSPLTHVLLLRPTGSKLNSGFNLEKEMEKNAL